MAEKKLTRPLKTLYKILFLLVAGPVIFLIARPIKNVRWFRHVFIILHAFFLTYCTLFLFNRPGWRWTDEKSLRKKLDNTESSKALRFINDNFLLVDNSFDKSLLPNPEGDENDSSSVVLTNRKSLTSFLQLLYEHITDVDLVVTDIGFTYKTTDDSLLQAAILQIYSEHKILLSIDPQQAGALRMIENPAAYGNISENAKEHLFTTHTVFKDGYYSLPYKIYSWLENKTPGQTFFGNNLFREKNANSKRGIALNTFFPQFRLTNEQLLMNKEPDSPGSSADMEKGTETSSRNYYYLSQPLSAAGHAEFVNNLQQRRQAGKKNIVFIGSFASADEDIHQTLYGELHGATILLNVVYSLYQKDHFLRLAYILFLLLGYWILSLILFYKGLGLSFKWRQRLARISPSLANPKSKKKSTAAAAIKKEDDTIAWFKNFFRFIYYFLLVKELPVTLLILFSFLMMFLFGTWPNILPLLIYMAGVKVSLDYASSHILNHTHNAGH